MENNSSNGWKVSIDEIPFNNAFLGQEGASFHIDIEYSGNDEFVVKTGIIQWIKMFLVGLVTFAFPIVIYNNWGEIAEKHIALQIMCVLLSIIPVVAMFFIIRTFLSNPHIVLNKRSGQIKFIENGVVLREIMISDINNFEIIETIYRYRARKKRGIGRIKEVPNYTIRIVTKNGENIDMCISTSKNKIDEIYKLANSFTTT